MDEIGKLDPRIQECIRKRGFAELSEIQNLALPLAGKGKNLLLIAPTGTGKTEGAMIPVFDAMLKGTGGGFTALYITPLRSLNRDMLQRLSWWCAELGLTIGLTNGDTTTSERRRQALSPPDLLIITPETLQALFMGKVLRKHLWNVRYVIIDEIHELAGSKRGAQLSVALERLVQYGGEFQRIGLSATVGNPRELGVSIITQSDAPRGKPASDMLASSAATSAPLATLGARMPSGAALAIAVMSSAPQGVDNALTRTMISLRP